MTAVTAREGRAPPFPLFIAGLSLKQILAWGTTYYLPSILERQIAAELGLPRELIFGGVTLMLVVAAVIAPRSGRYIDRNGVRGPMIAGTYCLAAGLAMLGVAQGPATYLAAWALFGLAVPLTMSIAAFAAVSQTYPERGRAGITTLMLFGGLSSGLVWPLTGWLETRYGWRATCLIFALAHVAIALPAAVFLVPRRDPAQLAKASSAAISPRLADHQRRSGFWLLVVGSGVGGLVTWGLPLYFVPMFRDAGIAAATAILLASLQAWFTFAARAFDLTMSARFGGMRLISAASLLPPLVFVLLMLALGPVGLGTTQTLLIAAALALYGFSAGLIAAGRATLPLELFGSEGYATTLGNLSFWLNLMFAASPLIFALLYDGYGAQAALVAGLVCSLISAIAFWRLDGLVTTSARAWRQG